MTIPLDVSDPPHLWLRLMPEGPLYLALAGVLPQSELAERLQRPAVAQLLQVGHVTVAMFDLMQFQALEPGHIAHLESLAHRLIKAGCTRLAMATTPGQTDLLERLARSLDRQSKALRAACFDQLQSAGQWLFSEQPSPASPASLPAASLAMESMASVVTMDPIGPVPTTELASAPLGSMLGPTVRPAQGEPTTMASAPPSLGPVISPMVRPSPRIAPLVPAATTRPSAQPLETTAPRAAPLFPSLVVASPTANQLLLGRPLLPGHVLDPDLLVTVTIGDAPRRFALLRDPGATDALLEEVMAEATVNLDRRELPLEERSLAGQHYVRSVGPLASEGLMSPRQIERLQDALGGRTLAVAIPTRGLLLAARVSPDNRVMLRGLRDLAHEAFAEGKMLALTPQLMLVEGGRVTGVYRPEVAPPSNGG